ncbi:MAG: hypothetical protein J0I08_17670 [Rhizobiales bacterium]|nr:hypothetical protein [Hyphomicrobiales bacterium]
MFSIKNALTSGAAALAVAATFGLSTAPSASAMTLAPTIAAPAGVDQVRWVCNDWGRCWWQPNAYRSYGYGYGYTAPRYGYYGGGWPYRHYRHSYYVPRFHGGWR